MDEPTSGLDGHAAAVVMRCVRAVANMQRTIVCTIHQPSSEIFSSFDMVVLLQTGGHMMYCGPLGNCQSHLRLCPCPRPMLACPKICCTRVCAAAHRVSLCCNACRPPRWRFDLLLLLCWCAPHPGKLFPGRLRRSESHRFLHALPDLACAACASRLAAMRECGQLDAGRGWRLCSRRKQRPRLCCLLRGEEPVALDSIRIIPPS